MNLRRTVLLAAVLSLALPGSPARADEKAPGVRGDLIASLDDAGKKLVALAEAVPAAKYGWRPAKGVRSFAEVFMHVGTANYTIPKFIGATPPDGTGFEMEKQVTEKEKVVEFLKGSIAFLKKTIAEAKDEDLDKTAKYFGMENSYRGTYLLCVAHDHEHLGQAIAYARSNGITPPWSKKDEAPKPAKK